MSEATFGVFRPGEHIDNTPVLPGRVVLVFGTTRVEMTRFDADRALTRMLVEVRRG